MIELRWDNKKVQILFFVLLLFSLLFIQLMPPHNHVFVKGVIGWTVLFFLPGFLLVSSVFNRELDLGEVVPLSFGLGLATFSVMGFLGYVSGCSITLLSVAIIIEIVGLLIWLKKRTAIIVKNYKVLFLLLTGIAFSALFLKIGAIQDGDTISHLTWIRRLFERGVADPAAFGPLPDGPPWSAYLYASWHLAIALVARIAQVDPIVIWVNLPSILVIVFTLSIWLFAKLLFKSERIAFTVALLYLLLEGSCNGMRYWIVSPYPIEIGLRFLLLVGLFLALQYIFDSKRRFLLLAILVAFALSLVHMSSFTYFYLLLALYAVFCLPFKEKRIEAKKAFIVIAAGLLFTAPVLFLKLFHLYTIPTGIEHFAWEPGAFRADRFIQLPFNMYILDYHLLFSQNPILPYVFLYHILIFVLLPLTLLKYWKERKPWAVFLSAGLMGTVLYIFNPLIVTPIIRMLSGSLVVKAASLVSFLGTFLTGFYIFKLLDYLERKLPRLRHETVIVPLFAVSFVLTTFLLTYHPSLPHADSFIKAARIDRYSGHLLSNMNKLSFIEEHTCQGSVILTSGEIGARLIGPYLDRYPMPPRIAETPGVENALDPTSEINEETLITLDRYQVRYVLTDNTLQSAKLNEYPVIFGEICKEGEYTLYEVLIDSPDKASAIYYERQRISDLDIEPVYEK
jgi:hypothetical protein